MNNKRFRIIPKKTFEIKHEFQMYPDDALISQVKPIQESMYDPKSSGIPLESLVEYPLLDAAKAFWEKGIKTYASSANQKDVNRDAYIILYWDSLNENNKKIAESFGEKHEYLKEKYVKIPVPVNDKTTVGEIKQKFKSIVNIFEAQ